MSFTQFGLPEVLVRAVADLGFDTPTPIQSQAIAPAASGRDLVACAATGSAIKNRASSTQIIRRFITAYSDNDRSLAPLSKEKAYRLWESTNGMRSHGRAIAHHQFKSASEHF